MQGKHCFLCVVVALVVIVVTVVVVAVAVVAIVASDWKLGTAVAEGVLIKCIVEINKAGYTATSVACGWAGAVMSLCKP